jgi:tetratricopeptide (TPR) repeat protein
MTIKISSSAFLSFLLFSGSCIPLLAQPKSDAELPAEPLPEKLDSDDLRTEDAQDRIVAAAWFAQGRVLQQREDFAGALRCYQRAWRWDPRAVLALHETLTLALVLKREDEAARYAVLAPDQIPPSPILLRRLAIFLTEERQWAQAATLYEKSISAQGSGGEKIDDLGAALVRFELGRLYFLSEDFTKSAASFARVRDVLLDPAMPLGEQAAKTLLGKPEETWLVMAESFLAAGRHDEAAALFAKADEGAPSKPLLALRLARVEAARKNREAALQKLDEYFAAKETAAGTEPYSLLSKLLAEGAADAKAARAEVIKRLKDLRQKDEKNGPLAFYLAEEMQNAGELAEAEVLYQQALVARPRSEVRQRLAEIYRKQGNAEKILEVAGPAAGKTASLDSLRETAQAIAADQELLGKLIEVARRLAKQPADKRPEGAVLTAALLALEGKQYDAAEELFTAELAESADNKGEVLLAWGLGLLTRSEHSRAAKVLQRGIDEKLLPERSALVHYFLAGALAMAKEDAQALNVAKRAVEIDPVNPLYESRLAWVHYHAKDLDNARRSYGELLAKYADNYKNSGVRDVVRECRLALSNIALRQDDFPASVEYLEQVLDEFPGDAGALNDLGYLWIERKMHLARGVSMAERAVAAEPENPSYRDSLGWGYYQEGRFADAVRELTLAAKQDLAGVILDHLGDAHLKAGDQAKAREAWQKAAAAFEKDGEQEKLEAVQKKLQE